jgi:hypothetical protein
LSSKKYANNRASWQIEKLVKEDKAIGGGVDRVLTGAWKSWALRLGSVAEKTV